MNFGSIGKSGMFPELDHFGKHGEISNPVRKGIMSSAGDFSPMEFHDL